MKEKILHNAEEINRLHKRIHETFRNREKGERQWSEWEQACKEFHETYDALAFPGGLGGAYERILSGDGEAIEAGLCFLECRPYFFRSGYMFKDILRKLKRAPLDGRQRTRLEEIQRKYETYRAGKRASQA